MWWVLGDKNELGAKTLKRRLEWASWGMKKNICFACHGGESARRETNDPKIKHWQCRQMGGGEALKMPSAGLVYIGWGPEIWLKKDDGGRESESGGHRAPENAKWRMGRVMCVGSGWRGEEGIGRCKNQYWEEPLLTTRRHIYFKMGMCGLAESDVRSPLGESKDFHLGLMTGDLLSPFIETSQRNMNGDISPIGLKLPQQQRNGLNVWLGSKTINNAFAEPLATFTATDWENDNTTTDRHKLGFEFLQTELLLDKVYKLENLLLCKLEDSDVVYAHERAERDAMTIIAEHDAVNPPTARELEMREMRSAGLREARARRLAQWKMLFALAKVQRETVKKALAELGEQPGITNVVIAENAEFDAGATVAPKDAIEEEVTIKRILPFSEQTEEFRERQRAISGSMDRPKMQPNNLQAA
ncbi:hypothetical protein K505DRAFT_341333 [Melanomma pulvis-pyrius CBS 109.77]|uniref:Uncharacterized protein n=1 Tax=Melanomma pulvis-pyrius CBS 109.77 TaxID=1314802 RepID=A0A6A6X0B8_9PLEO|nr:hypothetical protein K505DRAFT_341333 [Melanomma pulvis-pyrius CBS 109.77]